MPAVADPGFPRRRRGANPRGEGAPTYYLTNFSQKLHENEEIRTHGDPARFATGLYSRFVQLI